MSRFAQQQLQIYDPIPILDYQFLPYPFYQPNSFTMKKIIIVVITLMFFEVLTFAQVKITPDTASNLAVDTSFSSVNLDTYNNCPMIGESTNQRLQDLNKFKNRYTEPSQNDFNSNVTAASMLNPGNDETRWSTSNAVELTGFVFDVKPGGLETCNCHASDKSQMDTHIVLVADPNSTKGSQRIIVEITPRMRFLMMQKGIDWSTEKIKATYMGHWVKVKGWLFFDEEHKASAENTNPGNASNWRATSWEVHPITSIELVNNN